MNRFILLITSVYILLGSIVSAGEPTPAATSATSGEASDDDLGKSLENSEKNIKDGKIEAGGVIADANNRKNELTISSEAFDEIEKFIVRYSDEKPKCVERHASAAKWCLENLSPHILDGITALNSLASLGSTAIKDQCNKFAGAMDIAKTAMTAYTTACGAWKAGCGLACGAAREAIEGIIAQIPKSTLNCKKNPNYQGADPCPSLNTAYKNALEKIDKAAKEEKDKNEKKSIAGKDSLCREKYAQLLSSAVAGIGSLANSMQQGQNCEKATQGDSGLSNLNADQCKLPRNAKLPECICQKNPRTPGCANTLQKPGDGSMDQLTPGIGDRGGVNPSDHSLSGLSTDSGLPPIDHKDVNKGEGTAGAPMGGGNAGLGGGGGSGGGPGGGGAPGSAGIDLDKYGSGFMGGGGAGRFGGGGSGNDKYRAYLPGGAKDPARSLAGQAAWIKEVTGHGGKSNWDKIKERYRDNKSTLLNN